MKKVISFFFLVMILVWMTPPVYSLECADSEVGITFSQPTNKNRTIPMNKVMIEEEGRKDISQKSLVSDNKTKQLPKTNEEKGFLIEGLGWGTLFLVGLTHFLKSVRANKEVGK